MATDQGAQTPAHRFIELGAYVRRVHLRWGTEERLPHGEKVSGNDLGWNRAGDIGRVAELHEGSPPFPCPDCAEGDCETDHEEPGVCAGLTPYAVVRWERQEGEGFHRACIHADDEGRTWERVSSPGLGLPPLPVREKGADSPSRQGGLAPRELHEAAARHAEEGGCICRGPKPSRLCGAIREGLTCTRCEGHTGLHVACAGELGPHAISSWGTARQRAETLAEAVS